MVGDIGDPLAFGYVGGMVSNSVSMMKPSTAILGGLFFGSTGLVALALAVRSAISSEPLAVIAAGGIAAFCFGLLAPLPKALSRKMLPRTSFSADGTTVRPDRGMDLPIIISVCGVTGSGALIAVSVPMGMLHIPMSPTSRYVVPFTAGAVAIMGLPFVTQFLRRGTTKYLRLSPEGLEVAEGLRSHLAHWSEVVGVADAVPGKPPVTVGSVVVVLSDGSTQRFAGGGCTPDGRALRDLVHHYWRHPEDRPELTDGRAIQRLADLIAA